VESELIHSPLFPLHVNSGAFSIVHWDGQRRPRPKNGWAGSGTVQKKYFRIDANLILKYPVFDETLQNNYTKKLKKIFLFAYIRLSLSNIKFMYHIFIKKKNKKYVLARIFGFNNHFIKVTRTWLIF